MEKGRCGGMVALMMAGIQATGAAAPEAPVPQSAALQSRQHPIGWTRVTPAAAFSPRDTVEDVVFKDRMWLSNGYFHGSVLHRDLWSSLDGVVWSKVLDRTPYDGYSELVAFEGKMWAVKNSVWNSADGVNWSRVLENTPFGGRGYGETVVHDGKIWQLGSGGDVWSTPDGIHWTCVCEKAPFGVRYASAVVAHAGKLWLMGGATPGPSDPPEKGYPRSTTHSDVWCSADGANWTRVLDHAPWAPRQWFVAKDYAGEIWIVAGFDNANNRNLADVWHSPDGVEWKEFVSETSFSARHEPTCFVFDDSLWVAAGNSWPLNNDVWRLTRAEDGLAPALNRASGQGGSQSPWKRDVSRWDALRTSYQKARERSDCMAVPESAANVALGLSEQTSAAFYRKNPDENGSLENRWMQNQVALEAALKQSHVPADVCWTETLTPVELARYRVLVLMDAKIVTDAQAGLLRNWVADGGILIAGGTTSLFEPGSGQRANYLLADLFGVDYERDAGISDPKESDTFCIKPNQGPPKGVSGLDPENFRLMAYRGVKPVRSLGLYTLTDRVSAFLPGVAPGTACEYDLTLGYDKVKRGTAEALASFANGDAALTVNKVGKGLCYFWAPIYSGLCHVSHEWEEELNRHEFWPNVREVLAGMIKGGLAYAQTVLPVDVTGVSKTVEVTVRQQVEKNRWLVHLADCDPKSEPVKGAAMTVHPPAGKAVKRCYYPDTDTEVKLAGSEGGVTVPLRDFVAHDTVVVEWF